MAASTLSKGLEKKGKAITASSQRKSNIENGISGQKRGLERMQTDAVEARKCHSDSNVLDRVPSDGSTLDNECISSGPGQTLAANPQGLAPLGRKIRISRSLQDYFEEAKRKHLPPLNGQKKNYKNNNKKKGRSGLAFIRKRKKFKAASITDSNILKRNPRLWDASYPKMRYPEMSSFKRQSLGNEDWNSIEDILSVDVSGNSFQAPTLVEPCESDTVKQTNNERSERRPLMDVAEKHKDSGPNCEFIQEIMENKFTATTVIYDEAELELMEDIEKEYSHCTSKFK